MLIGLSLMAASFIHGKLYHQKTLPKLTLRERSVGVVDGMAGVFTMVIILGGIISGVFTATEAGAAASVYALFLTVVVYREIKLPSLPESSGMLPDERGRHAADRDLFGLCLDLTYENLPTHAGG